MSETKLSETLYIECITLLVKNCVDKIFSKTVSIVKDQITKMKIDMNIAFRDFVKKTYGKYSKVKTILYKDAPQPLYDFFVCPDLRFKNKLIDAHDIDNILNTLPDTHFYLIQGTGGIGKSTLLKHFVLNELTKRDMMPVFIELKDFNRSNESLQKNIYDYLLRMGVLLKQEYIDYALESGCFLFLLDGYDELNETKQGTFFEELNEICDKYDKNYFIISSRPIGDERTIAFQRFVNIYTMPFSKEKAIELMENINFDASIKEKFVKQLDNELYHKHKSFASNPLLLTIMLLTYDQYADIPDKKHIFYSNAFETLYSKHDATKGGYKREMYTNLAQDVFRKVLSEFCFISYMKDQYEFTIEELRSIINKALCDNSIVVDVDDYINDLKISVCILYIDGRNYKFIHRSFQEYFAACHIKNMTEENMKLVVKHLIQNVNWISDQVIGMLFDMNQDVFERAIIIPILEENELNFSCDEDKFEHYLKWIVNYVGIHKFENTDKEGLVIGIVDNKAEIVYHFLDRMVRHKYTTINEDNLFIKYLKEKDEKIDDVTEYSIENVIQDKEMYALIKNTWVGNCIRSIMNLLPSLTQKATRQNEDILSLINK